MAFDEKLAERMRRALRGKGEITERKMFGGLCFLRSGKMCCGLLKDAFVARVDPKESPKLLKMPGVRRMDFTGRPMKNFLYVSPKILRSGPQLNAWVKRGVEFASSLT